MRPLSNVSASLEARIEEMKRNYMTQMQKSRDTTNGFIKNAEKLLKNENQHIPKEITQLCLSFYHLWHKFEIQLPTMTEKQFWKSYQIEPTLGCCGWRGLKKITRKCDNISFSLKLMKKAGKTQQHINAFYTEALILQLCNHQNLVSFHGYCETKKRIYIVEELCNGLNILERIISSKSCNEKLIINIIKQTTEGLAYLHSFGFIHGNLTLHNIKYVTKDADAKIKIVEFERAGYCRHIDCNDEYCTKANEYSIYMAPETFGENKEYKEYKESADMWSLGIIIYVLLRGCLPFYEELHDVQNLSTLILETEYSFPSPYCDHVAETAKDLVQRLLIKDPDKRLTAWQVLNHPWIVNEDIADDKNFSDEYFNQLTFLRWL